MSLPNPSMSFSPFAILTAEELNDLVENIESLAGGTGFTANSVPGSALEGVPSEKLNSTVAFFAYRGTAWTTSSSFAKVTPDTEVFDVGSNFATGTFTAPVDGVYHFDACAGHENGTTTRRIEVALHVDGATYAIGDSIVGSYGGAAVSATISLTAGQIVELYAFTDVAVAGAPNRQTYLSGYLVGTV